MNLHNLKETISDHRGVVFLCLAICMNSWGMGAISPILPLFTDQEFDVNRTQVGLAVGLHGISRLFIAVPAGYMAQRRGCRFILNLGTAINLAGAAMVALSFNYYWLLGWRAISGLGSAMFTTGVSIYLRDVATPESRARFLSLQDMSILVGVTFGPYMGGIMGEQWGLRSPLYLQVLLILVSMILLYKFVPEPGVWSGSGRRTGTGLTLEQSGGRSRPPATPGSLRRLLVSPAFIFVGLFALMIVANRQGGRFSVMPLYGEAKGFRPDQLGAFISITHFPQFFTTVISGFLSDRIGRKATIIPAVLLISLGIVVFVWGDTFLMLITSGVLLGLGEGLAGPPSVAFFADIAPPGLEGVTMGLFRTFGGLGSLLGALLLGGVADLWGFGWSLGIDAVLLVASALGVMLLVRETAVGRSQRTAASS